MRHAVPKTYVLRVRLSPVRHMTGRGLLGDLPLRVLLADEVMEAVLRSAGHTATTFLQECRGFAAGLQPDAVAA